MTRSDIDPTELIPCGCGCGKMILKWYIRKYHSPVERKFLVGHNLTPINKERIGANHFRWKGGKRISNGYAFVLKRDHHFADINGYVAEHRLIWEQHNKAALLPWADVHHINEKRDDNRIENLKAMMHGDHMRITNTKDKTNRVCMICKRTDNDISCFKSYQWHLLANRWVCMSCYKRYGYHQKRGGGLVFH